MPFDPFLIENKSKWQSQLQQFQLEIGALDVDVKSCLEDSFRNLHSSEEAFLVLKRLLERHLRKDIGKLFEVHYSDILDRYDKELRLISASFTEGSADSDRFASTLGPRYFPPVSSSICWVRHLQTRVTSPMLKFMQIGQLIESNKGKELYERHLCLIQRMNKFEEDLFSKWRQQSHECLGKHLERNLWKYAGTSKPNSPSKRMSMVGQDLVIGREQPKQTKSLCMNILNKLLNTQPLSNCYTDMIYI